MRHFEVQRSGAKESRDSPNGLDSSLRLVSPGLLADHDDDMVMSSSEIFRF